MIVYCYSQAKLQLNLKNPISNFKETVIPGVNTYFFSELPKASTHQGVRRKSYREFNHVVVKFQNTQA